MGLDMYAFTTATVPPAETDFAAPYDTTEIAYWRKHPDLHGWMENLYRAKGGERDSFNTTTLLLRRIDLERLKADIEAEALPHTTGFFFGRSEPEDKASHLEFVEKALAAVDAGEYVFYDSWW